MKNQIWKRLLAMVLVVVMSVTLLPTAAYAALLDNTPDQNEKILRELTEFWGDEKTAEEAMVLLTRKEMSLPTGAARLPLRRRAAP